MITDNLMALGSWDLKLKPNAPTKLRRAMVFGANVFVTAAHLGDADVTFATLKTASVWAGLTTRKSDKLTSFGGTGLLGYLQTGKGHAVGTGLTTMPAQFADCLTDWLTGNQYSNGLSKGSAHSATTTTVTLQDYTYSPPMKPIMDEVAKATGNEYRVLPTGAVDYGVATSLFVSTPTVILAPGFRGREGTYHGLNVTDWAPSQDVDDLRHYGYYRSQDGTITSSAGIPSNHTTFYYFGSSSLIATYGSEYITLDTNDATDAANQGAAIAAEYADIHYDFGQCGVREYCLPRLLTPGDYIYLYDLENDLYDTTNQITFGGETLFPKKVRCVGITWPLEAGMGVYCHYAGTITDLTDWIIWETEESSRLSIETLPRRVNDPASRKLNLVR